MAERAAQRGSYVLGIDLGTTYSAAAIARGSSVEPFVLGTIAAQIPSIVLHRADGQILVGEAAERRAGAEPTRAAREFKRRLGDPVPVIVGGTPYGAESLMAQMLEAIVQQVTEREGQPPTTIVLTHPANYSDYKRGLLHEAARLAGLDLERVRLITEPEAAAIAYAHHERIEPGEIIAVYDFGGGTFDAAVVRGTGDGFELIGTPEGMERLGGIDVDQAVLAHVDTVLDGLVSAADATDGTVVAGQARLRDECRRAKEALSSDTDATIPVAIPGVQTDVRLTRDELESMVRPRIIETVTALQRTIASAGVATSDVSRVLLVGGTSRMPIVAQTVRELIGRPVSVDADPKLSIATGAALSAAPAEATASLSPPPALTVAPVSASATTPSTSGGSGRRRGIIVGAAAVAAAAVAAIVVISLSGGDDPVASATTSTVVGETGATQAPTGEPDVSSSASITDVEIPSSAATEPDGGPNVQRLPFDGSDGIVAVATGPDGAVYVVTAAPALARIVGGQTTELVGLAVEDGHVGGMTIGSDGAVFVTTAVGVVQIADAARTVLLDGAGAGLSTDLGPLTLDGSGSLYIADNGTSRIVRLAPDGGLTLVAGTGVAAAEGSIPPEGVVAVTSDIGRVTGLAVDAGGRLLIADAGLRRVRAVASDGNITTVVGGGDVTPGDVPPDAGPTDLALSGIDALAVDRDQRLFVADSGSGVMIRVDPDGAMTAIAADDDLLRAPDGTGPSALRGLAIGPAGVVIISDGSALWSLTSDGEQR